MSSASRRYPDAVDPSLVGTYPALSKSGGGYVWDNVLEYRVWCHPTEGEKDSGDYYYAFATYGAAAEFAAARAGAKEPLALIEQLEYIAEDEPGQYVHVKERRVTEWPVKFLSRPRRTDRTIIDFLAPDAPENRLDILRGLALARDGAPAATPGSENAPAHALFQWLDEALAGGIPAGVAAFCANVCETSKGFELELVGTSEFDPDDSDWACAELFTSRDKPRFAISRETAGGDWTAALGYVVRKMREYLSAGSAGARTLQSTRAVAVGFVDGDLVLVWRAESQIRE